MTALIWTLAVLGYSAAALWTARWRFGRMRARSIDRRADSLRSWTPTEHVLRSAVDDFDRVDRPFIAGIAVVQGLTWPVMLPVTAAIPLLARVITGSPPLSRAELAARHDADREKIADLERELGIT